MSGSSCKFSHDGGIFNSKLLEYKQKLYMKSKTKENLELNMTVKSYY